MKSMTLAVAATLFQPLAFGQELSTARYVGALDGAVEACAAAFPAEASRYRAAPQQAWRCNGDAKAYRIWHDEQKNAERNREEYRRGFAEGSNSLGSTSAQRARECRSLEELPCSRDPAIR